jgi:Domain of unknown function (DUF4280)
MGLLAVTGAAIECTFGDAPSALITLPDTGVIADGRPVGRITDIAPEVNIPSFGMCMSLLNPEVDAATAAAMGVLTPMPCVPLIVDPWVPGAPTVLVAGVPALTQDSVCMCAWEGVITIAEPGQFSVTAE